jgi:DNA-binding Lrp family transcriptional regulator
MDDRSTPQYTHSHREKAAQHALTERDKDVIRAVQGDLPLVRDPFAPAAAALGTTVDGLIEELQDLERRGFLRRFAAILRHRKAGFGANGMAVWNVSEDDVDEMGQTMAGYTAISHCYRRPTYEDWKYNLFTMIHARKKGDCEAFVEQLSEQHGLTDVEILYSTTEFKKIRLEYFTPAYDEWERAHLKGSNRK